MGIAKRKNILGWSVTLALTVAANADAIGQSASAPQPDVAARLRQALPFPVRSLDRRFGNSVGIAFSPDRGFYMLLGAESAEMRLRAEALRRSLQDRPGNASRYELLGTYENHLGEKGRSQQAFGQAALLYGRQAKNPHEPWTEREKGLTGLTRVLDEMGRTTEAEIRLRRALGMHPRSWRLWDALGEVRSDEAEAKVSGPAARTSVAQALRLDRKARASFDRAVRLAPRQGMAYACRGQFLGIDHPALRDEVFRLWGKVSPPYYAAVIPSALADFRHAAFLRPNDPYAIAYPVWMELFTEGFFHLHLRFPSQAAWHALPVSVRVSALEAVRRLTRLARGKGPLARRAAAPLGFLLYESQREVGPAEAALRRGLSGPEHEQAAEMLIHIMSIERQDRALSLFCQRQARQHNTPRLHLIGAWAEIDQKHWTQAKVQVEQARALEPDDPTDLLMLAALTLKEDRSEGLAGGKALLGRAEASLKHAPSSDIPPVEQEEYRVTHAFFLALSGEGEGARAELRTALAADPRNKGAARGLELLTGSLNMKHANAASTAHPQRSH